MRMIAMGAYLQPSNRASAGHDREVRQGSPFSMSNYEPGTESSFVESPSSATKGSMMP